MTTIVSSGISPTNPNVWRVVVAIPEGDEFVDVVNISLLRQEVVAVLAEDRLQSVNQNGPDGITFGFLTPPSEGEQNTIDGKVTAHNPTLHTQEQQDVIDRGVDWADLRAQAVAMITQGDNALNGITANLATIDTIEANVTAATTLGQLKAALGPLSNVLRGILNRQAGIITNFQRVLRALRWLVPGE